MKLQKQLKRIAQKHEQDKQAKQWIDDLDAMHPARIGKHMPAQETEYHQSIRMSELCDATRRRGAGQITGNGGVILRPGGMSAYREFHDLYTREPEKEKPRQNIDMHKAGQYDGPPFRVVAFPETFCILCMRKDVGPSKNGCTEKDCLCCPMLDNTPIIEDIPELNLRVNDLIRAVICPQCKIDIVGERRRLNLTQMRIVHDGMDMPLHVIKAMERYRRLKTNVKHVLKASRMVAIEGMQGIRAEGIGTA